MGESDKNKNKFHLLSISLLFCFTFILFFPPKCPWIASGIIISIYTLIKPYTTGLLIMASYLLVTGSFLSNMKIKVCKDMSNFKVHRIWKEEWHLLMMIHQERWMLVLYGQGLHLKKINSLNLYKDNSFLILIWMIMTMWELVVKERNAVLIAGNLWS